MGKRIQLDADDLEYEAIPDAPPPTCESGKFVFTTESKASSAAQNMRRFHSDPFIHHYRCPLCGNWHTGHKRNSGGKVSGLVNEIKKMKDACEEPANYRFEVLQMIAEGTNFDREIRKNRKACNKLINSRMIVNNGGVLEITGEGKECLWERTQRASK